MRGRRDSSLKNWVIIAMGFVDMIIDLPGTEPVWGKDSMECPIGRSRNGNSSLCLFQSSLRLIVWQGLGYVLEL